MSITAADGSKPEESSKEGRIVYDDEMLDKLLDRKQEGITTEDKDMLSEYFSAFKVASFSIKEDQEPADEVEVLKEESEPVDSQYWEKLLRHHYEQHLEEENQQLMGMGKGKRQRKAVSGLSCVCWLHQVLLFLCPFSSLHWSVLLLLGVFVAL